MTAIFTPTRPVPPLPGTTLLGLKASTLLELGDAVESGFKTSALERFSKRVGLTLNDTLKLIGLSASSYHEHQRAQRPIKNTLSGQLYQLACVTEAAEAYFEDPAEAHTWLKTPRTTFGGRTPLHFALLPGGTAYVTTILSRLEHGVYT